MAPDLTFSKKRAVCRVMKHALVLFAATAAFFIAADRALAGVKLPFGPGERLTYEIHWTFVHAGDAVLEVMPDTEEGGRPARHFKAVAKTRPWVDNFYRVRDFIDAWTDLDVTHSLRYLKDQNEGDYKKKAEIIFNPDDSTSRRYVRGDLRYEMEQPQKVFDPMSTLFAFRKQILYKTMQFGANVTDGKKTVVGEAFVEGTETVETPMGEFETFRVRLDVKHISGVFKKSPNAELLVWFTADERRIPVKVRSKVVVGHFTLELADYRPPGEYETDAVH